MTELAIINETSLAAVYATKQGADEIIDRIRAAAMAEAQDLTTAAGRKRVASVAYRVAQSKTAIDDQGKKLGEAAKKQVDAINATRKRLRDGLDALRDEVRAPLSDWEAKEAHRVEALELMLRGITIGGLTTGDAPAQIHEHIVSIQRLPQGSGWAEFEERASAATASVLESLHALLVGAQDRVAKEDAERHRLAAQEAELAELRAMKAEAERKAAEAEAREQAAHLEATRKEREAAAAQAEKDRLAEAERRHAAAVERAKADAIEAERKRAESAEKAKSEADAKRASNAKHRASVIAAAVKALTPAIGAEAATAAINAIIAGDVPRVAIQF
jgi:hypothetical protein